MLKQTKPISDERAQWLAAHIVPHEAALRAWLKGKTSLGSDVDDIVQETYAILATKRTVDTINNPKTYAFQVAYSVILQLIVVGSSAQARAVGTAYSVRLGDEDGQMQIRVASGRVAVEPPRPELAAPLDAIRNLFGSKSTHGAYLNANQEAEVRVGTDGLDKGEIQVSIRDLQPGIFERSLMWREGLLSFEGVTLAEAIAEFSRYSRQKILIRGALAHERVSGLFAAADPAAFSRAIAASLKIKIRTEQGALVLYRP